MNKQSAMDPSDQPKSKKPHKIFRVLGLVLLVLVAIAGTAYLVYAWQQDEADKQRQALEDTFDKHIEDKQKSDTDDDPAGEFTYISKVGGLSLTLSESYAVIANVDGNKGGSPGASIKIGKKDTQNIITDSHYGSVGIEIDAFSVVIDMEVNTIQSDLREEGYSDIKVSDITIGTQSGKLIEAMSAPVGSTGAKAVYVVRSGDYFYKIIATGKAQPGPDILKAVLDGIKIESKTN